MVREPLKVLSRERPQSCGLGRGIWNLGAPEECTGMGRGRHQRQGVLRRRGLKTARGGGFQKRREPRGGKSSVMNLMFVSLPNSCVEGLMPRVAVFGFGTYKEVIKVKWGNKGGAPIQQD